MADYINPTNYNNMIEALNNFAAKTLETCERLNAACAQCTAVLGPDDVATNKITSSASVICAKYEELVLEARRIAINMQQELEDYYERERANEADGDSSGDDDF